MKLELTLNRTYYPEGTNGQIVIAGKRLCSSIELPWKANQSRVSCIPEGVYELKKRYSPKHGHHLQVINVPGRDLILLHPANDALKELMGCIAPVSLLTGEGKGASSRIALKKVLDKVFPELEKGNKVFLIIKSDQS